MTTPAGEGAQSGTTDPQSGTGPQGNTDQPTNQPAPGAPSGTETGQQPAGQQGVTQEQFDALKRQLQAADQKRTTAEAELKKLTDAQLSEQEKTKRDLEEAQKERQRLESELKLQRIQNAFLSDNTYDWHDPRAALKLADLSGVEIKDDGSVNGLKDALKAVADANGWMLKPKETGGDDGKGTGTGKPAGGATGVAGTAGNNASGKDRASLEQRFPALRGRVS